MAVVLALPRPEARTAGGAMSLGNPGAPHSLRAWQLERLHESATGLLPPDIRRRELAFAATLPQRTHKACRWTFLGPRDRGGRTRALAVDVTDAHIWLAGSVTGGLSAQHRRRPQLDPHQPPGRHDRREQPGAGYPRRP